MEANDELLCKSCTEEDHIEPGTIRAAANFDAKKDAETIHSGLKGAGANEKVVMDIVCKRTNAQRQRIRTQYTQMFGADLIKDFKTELSGFFRELMIGLLRTPDEFDAKQLRKAVKGAGTDEAVLIEILCTRTNAEIRSIREAYKKRYSLDLEKDVADDTSGHFRRLLVSLCQANRDENPNVDVKKAARDAKILSDGKLSKDQSSFNAMICSQSKPQLLRCFNEYYTLTGHHIESAVEQQLSGDLRQGTLNLVKSIKNRPALFAEILNKALKGLGVNERGLIRVVVSRSEIDLANIKEEYHKLYSSTIDATIAADLSGDFAKALITVLRGN